MARWKIALSLWIWKTLIATCICRGWKYFEARKMPSLTLVLDGSTIRLELAQDHRGLWRKAAPGVLSRLQSASLRTNPKGPGLILKTLHLNLHKALEYFWGVLRWLWLMCKDKEVREVGSNEPSLFLFWLEIKYKHCSSSLPNRLHLPRTVSLHIALECQRAILHPSLVFFTGWRL